MFKARKSKKKKPKLAPSENLGQAEEVDYSQSAPTTEELPAPTSTPAPAPGSSGTPPPNPLPVRFRPIQPIVRPPTTQVSMWIHKSHRPNSLSCQLPDLGLLERFRALTKIMQFKLVF
ncbi:hypothetical protein PIB30_083269 [Stylosanthes scabra]|uniref:Uncharacterized protein n=1 Tax=Stylosanthes scabra TaxID=79078 RepID=A0ABU6RSM3_9FABA|nr:hypothetical protein [Stylosanthes scabra]